MNKPVILFFSTPPDVAVAQPPRVEEKVAVHDGKGAVQQRLPCGRVRLKLPERGEEAKGEKTPIIPV